MALFSSLLQAIPAIAYGFKGVNTKPQKRIAGQFEGLSQAMLDPNNPTYQRLYEQERGASQQDIASAIAEISRQNRKLNALGRGPLLSQERGGEQLFRQTIMGSQRAGDMARQRARQIISGAQAPLSAAYNAYGQTAQADFGNNQRRVGAYGTIADYMKELFGL